MFSISGYPAINNLANSYKQIFEYKKAENCYLKLIKKNPNYLQALVNFANLKRELNFPNQYDIEPNMIYPTVKIFNKNKNVLGMMPHPERASFWFQLPRYLHNDFSRSRRELSLKQGPWVKLFESLGDYVRGQKR